MTAQRAEDRLAVGFEFRRLAQIFGREAAAKIDHGEIDPALGAGLEDRGSRGKRTVPRFHVVLLRADVERDAVRDEAELVRMLDDVGRVVRLTAELARQRPFGAGSVAMNTADHAA